MKESFSARLPAVSEIRTYLGRVVACRLGDTGLLRGAGLPAVSEIRDYLCGVAGEDTCLARDSQVSRRVPTKLCDLASLRETPARTTSVPLRLCEIPLRAISVHPNSRASITITSTAALNASTTDPLP